MSVTETVDNPMTAGLRYRCRASGHCQSAQWLLATRIAAFVMIFIWFQTTVVVSHGQSLYSGQQSGGDPAFQAGTLYAKSLVQFMSDKPAQEVWTPIKTDISDCSGSQFTHQE